MRFWLAAFVVLFAAVELFEWVTQLGSLQPTGLWLVPGGMGLAALSNVAHWPKATDADGLKEEEPKRTDKVAPTKPIQEKISSTSSTVVERTVEQGRTLESIADPSEQDSISFKVRPLKR